MLVVIDWMATEDKRRALAPSVGQRTHRRLQFGNTLEVKKNLEVVSLLVDSKFYIFVQMANWEAAMEFQAFVEVFFKGFFFFLFPLLLLTEINRMGI